MDVQLTKDSTSSSIHHWAIPGEVTPVSGLPTGMVNLNVEGRACTSPVEGFGSMRLVTYRLPLMGVTSSPAEIVHIWKSNFSSLWPAGNHFHACGKGMLPGVTGVINLTLPGGIRLYTGAVVMHSGETSFTLMTLQGHMFSGWITFSSYVENDVPYIQTQALLRPNDLLYEFVFLLGIGPSAEDKFWHATLLNLGRALGVSSTVEQVNQMIDRSWQWKHFGNLRYNAAIGSVFYQLTSPFRRLFHSSI